MDPLTPKPEATSEPAQSSSVETVAALAAQYARLENIVMWGLGAVIMIGFGLNIFLAKQVKVVQASLKEQRVMVQQFTKGYRENDEPLIRNFLGALQRYATTNKDFQPILEKYRPALSNYLFPPRAQPATPASAAQPPAAATPAAPKK